MFQLRFWVLVICLGLLFAPSVAAGSLADIREASYAVDLPALQELRLQWETAADEGRKYHALAAIYNFYADYYDFVEGNSGLRREYTDRTIEAAETALEYGVVEAGVYALLADGYARRITGALTGIRFGSRLSAAVEQAEALDSTAEDLLYVQGKRYLLAPSLAGGDREKALEQFERLVQAYPTSYFYNLLLSQALEAQQPQRAAAVREHAETLRR